MSHSTVLHTPRSIFRHWIYYIIGKDIGNVKNRVSSKSHFMSGHDESKCQLSINLIPQTFKILTFPKNIPHVHNLEVGFLGCIFRSSCRMEMSFNSFIRYKTLDGGVWKLHDVTYTSAPSTDPQIIWAIYKFSIRQWLQNRTILPLKFKWISSSVFAQTVWNFFD